VKKRKRTIEQIRFQRLHKPFGSQMRLCITRRTHRLAIEDEHAIPIAIPAQRKELEKTFDGINGREASETFEESTGLCLLGFTEFARRTQVRSVTTFSGSAISTLASESNQAPFGCFIPVTTREVVDGQC
jgi:hypothetical protein